MLVWSQGLNFFGYLIDDLYKLGRFSRGNPRKMDSIRFNAHIFHQVFKQRKLPTCVVITFQVMAFSGMSPGYPYAIGPGA
jgi:hypothetical protein